jgi:predicted Kef-type K+ transport protein
MPGKDAGPVLARLRVCGVPRRRVSTTSIRTEMMIGVILAAAVVGGLLARSLGLPPLVGFLLAGFALRLAGVAPQEWLLELAHAGVLVLLFSVGLKLRLKSLGRVEVVAGGLSHLLLYAGSVALALTVFSDLGVVGVLALALAFGFSSTVVAAKVLEEKRELRAFHGRVAVGILIVQDLVAVALLVLVGQGALSWWTPLLLLALLLAAPLMRRLLTWCGHGEMLVLLGMLLSLGVGGASFSSVGLSSELGALAVGTLLAPHPASAQLSFRLWSIKELLLAGFFVVIGMSVSPDWASLGVATLFIALLPLKALVFFVLLTRFRLRARSSFLAAIALASYSEFGLIVVKLMTDAGTLPEYWLGVMGLTVACSFVIAAPLNRLSHRLFERWREHMTPLERPERHPDDRPISLGSAEVLVFGMGRVGTGAYDYLRSQKLRVVGLDSDPAKVERHLRSGRRVVYGDAEDPDLWMRLNLQGVRAVLLALPDSEAKRLSATTLRREGYGGFISATNVFEDEAQQILDAGCDATFNYFNDAGLGFAKLTWDNVRASAELRPPD